MATLIAKITTANSAATLTRDYENSTSAKSPTVQSIADLLQSVVGGTEAQPSVAVSVRENATRASQTLTLTSVVATNSATINGLAFTAVASGASAVQFNVGADDAATAANLAAAINNSVNAAILGLVTATVTSTAASPAVVKVYSTDYGIYGNTVTISASGSPLVAGGSRLAGGAVDAGAKTYTF